MLILAPWSPNGVQDDDVAFPSHSFRSSVLDEFLVVLDDELDDPSRILEQLEHYARTRPEVLERRPFWNAIIARRWSPLVEAAMTVWWEHVLWYSRRYQLSLIHVLDSVGFVPHRVEIDNFGLFGFQCGVAARSAQLGLPA